MNPDLILWLLVATSALFALLNQAKPQPTVKPKVPTGLTATLTAVAWLHIGLWVLAAWATGYWQIAVSMGVVFLITTAGAAARAAGSAK